MKYLYLLLAIAFEILGTSSLQESQQFTKWKPSILVVVGFGLAFFFLSASLKYLPLGIVYALWAGIGIVAISLISVFRFKQSLDLPAVIGILLIVIGVVIIQLFSKVKTH